MIEKRESYTSTEMEEVINHFVEYLNRWWNHQGFKDDEVSPYRYESFTVTNPDKGLYGEVLFVKEEKLETGPFTTRVLIMQVTDGDDGGPNDLIAGWQGDFGDGEELSWIIQVFDTMPALIWTKEDGYRSPPNGEMKP